MRREAFIREEGGGSGLRREFPAEDLFIISKSHCEDSRLLGVFRDPLKDFLEVLQSGTRASKENSRLSVEAMRKGVEDGPETPVVIEDHED